MLLDPKRLIDRSIADLTQLSSLLAAEVRGEPLLQSPEQRACEEAIATIGNLIPRLKVARNVPLVQLPANYCPACED
jgi:hypothetical protein